MPAIVYRVFQKPIVLGALLGALCGLLTSKLVHAAECSDPAVSAAMKNLDVELKRAKIHVQTDEENLGNVKENVEEMNKFTKGKLVTAVQGSMKIGFLFASDETKAKVRSFFDEHLLVHGNLDYYPEIKAKAPMIRVSSLADSERGLQQVLQIDKSERDKLAKVSERSRSRLHEKVRSDLKEIQDSPKSVSQLDKFAETTENIADVEDQYAAAKASVEISRERYERIEGLRAETSALCVPDVNVVNREREPNRSPAVVERSDRGVNISGLAEAEGMWRPGDDQRGIDRNHLSTAGSGR